MQLFHDLLDLVLPMSCVCCLRPGSLWCTSCRPISRPEPLPLLSDPQVYASGEYAGELREALLAYKERGVRGLVAGLAGYLGDAVDVAIRAGPSGAPTPLLVPVPSSRAAARQRGGDHLRRLGRLAAREARLDLVPALRLVGPVADSAGLSGVQRAANLAGRMRALPADPGRVRPVVIVDDIVTTGATLTEARRALAAAGWPVAAAAVVAATTLRRPRRQQLADER